MAKRSRSVRPGPARPKRAGTVRGLLGFVVGAVGLVHLYALVLIWAPVPATVTMLQSRISGPGVGYLWTPLEEMSPHLIRAVIAGEDTRFCDHSGIDLDAIGEALAERRASGRVRGASTLSQQTAKNVFLWNGGGWLRKVPETWFAVLIDGVWGKRRILEVYLNVAEWGDGRFGGEAAARHYFGKSAADLSRLEASRLAAVLPSPNRWKAEPPGPYVRRQSATLRRRMDVIERDGLAACVLDRR